MLDNSHGLSFEKAPQACTGATCFWYSSLPAPEQSIYLSITNKQPSTQQAQTRQSTSHTLVPKSSKLRKQEHPLSSSPNVSTHPMAHNTSPNTPRRSSPPLPPKNNPHHTTPYRLSPQKPKHILSEEASRNWNPRRRNTTTPPSSSRPRALSSAHTARHTSSTSTSREKSHSKKAKSYPPVTS